MPAELSKCKITVLKVTVNRDLADEYLDVEGEFGPCERFKAGQEFILERPFGIPEGFCAWAWADIRNDIMGIMSGADKPWMKQRGVEIAACTDWFRPVYFKIERVD